MSYRRTIRERRRKTKPLHRGFFICLLTYTIHAWYNCIIKGKGEWYKVRQIKFRVWDSERKQMYNLSENRFSFGLFEGHRAISWEDVFAEQHEELIPLQYTGLKDKNGREIYEGDIVIRSYRESQTTAVRKIVFHNDGFKIQEIGKYAGLSLLYPALDDIEIIGNIYENPELLEV